MIASLLHRDGQLAIGELHRRDGTRDRGLDGVAELLERGVDLVLHGQALLESPSSRPCGASSATTS